MAVFTVYDSGILTPLQPGAWVEYILDTPLSRGPLLIILGIDLVKAPAPTWQHAGQCCMRLMNQSQLFTGPIEDIPLLQSEQLPPSGYEWSVRDSVIQKTPAMVATTRENGFRGAAWAVNRWLGPYRAKITVIE
jgi:hypothetical protein